MAPPRSTVPPYYTADSDDSGGHSARVKVKYRIDKRLDEAWVPMASFSADSDPERRQSLCSALGGEVRVLDVEHNTELSRVTYE